MIKLRLVPHKAYDGGIVEVWRDGDFCGGIYPTEDGLRIISKYFAPGEDLFVHFGTEIPKRKKT